METDYRDIQALNAAQADRNKQGLPPRPNPFLAVSDIAEYKNVTVMLEMLWQYDG